MRILLTTPLGWAILLGLLGLGLRLVPRKSRDGTRRRGLPGAVLFLLLAWLVPLVAATPFVAERAAAPLLREARNAPRPVWAAMQPPEAIVVLGGGLDGPREPGVLLGHETGRRLHRALATSRTWPDALVVFSGGAQPDHEVSSAIRMAEEARALGLEEARIVLENRSLTTRENAVNVASWLRENDVQRVALVTSAVHMPRALDCFRHEGVDAMPMPIGRPVAFTSLPDALWVAPSALVDTTLAIHEHIGRLYYRIRGWTD